MTVAGVTSLLGRAVLGWVFDMASIGGSIGFAYTSLSSCKYAWNEKRWDILIFGVLGSLLSIAMAVLLLVPVPGLNVSLGNQSYILLIIWTSLGLAVYLRGQLLFELGTKVRKTMRK